MTQQDMPRKTVISEIASQSGVSKVDAERILRIAMSAVAAEIAARGRFHIAEIGSISVARRPPRRFFNPRTRKESVSSGDVSLKINISKKMRRKLE